MKEKEEEGEEERGKREEGREGWREDWSSFSHHSCASGVTNV